MRSKVLIAVVLGLLGFAGPLLAAHEQADDLSAITPFVNDQTVAIMRVDLSRLDFSAATNQLLKPLCVTESEQQFFEVVLRELDQWIERNKSDGPAHFYVITTIGYYPDPGRAAEFGKDWPVALVSYSTFAVVPGILEKAINELHKDIQAHAKLAWPNAKPERYPDCRQIHGAAVIGMSALLDQLATLQPAPRPEFVKALSAAGDQPVQVALAPPPIFARAASEILLDPLPWTDKPIGPLFSRGVRWISIGVDPNPDHFAGQMIAQSADAESAHALAETLKQFAAGLSQHWLKLECPDGALRAGQMMSILPDAKRDQLVLTLDESRAKQVQMLLQGTVVRTEAVSNLRASMDNLKHLCLGLLKYEDSHHKLPERAIRDKNGKPLLSWRVAILSELDNSALYKEFHLDEPWDSEHNRKLIDRMPAIFRGPDTSPGKTHYLAPVGENLAFEPNKLLASEDFTDGAAKTIVLVEADPTHAVVWTKPDDLEVDLENPTRGLPTDKPRFNAVFLDGHVEALPSTIKPKTLRAMFTRNGGETFDRGDY